jgi:hypothetical protein
LNNGDSLIYDLATRPSDALTDVFSLDSEGRLLVTVNGTLLFLMECPSDLYFHVSYSSNGDCTAVVLDSQNANVPIPWSSVSSEPSSIPSIAHSSSPSSVGPTPSSNTSAPASSAPANGSPSSPESSQLPSAVSSQPPSPASSSPPSNSPVAFALDVDTSPVDRTIYQLDGNSDPDQFGTLNAVAYDQNGNPIPNATLNFTCSAGTDCIFCDAPGGSPITFGVTDANGTFTFYLAAYQRGSKTVEVSLDVGSIAPNVSVWTVLPLIDCQASTFVGNATRDGSPSPASSLTDLIMGADNVTFYSHVVDLNGDPLENITTTVAIDYPDKKVKRSPAGGQIVSDANGDALYVDTDMAIESLTWTGQFEGCSDIHYIPVKYFYDPVCNSANVISPTLDESLSISDPLPLSVQYSADVGSIAGAEIDVTWNGGNTQLFLDSNGAANSSINYTGGTATSQEFTFTFVGADPACQATVPFTWLRTCDQTQSSMIANTYNPYIDDPFSISVTVLDSQGLDLEGQTVTISGSRHVDTYTGVSDVNGLATWNAGNPYLDVVGLETFTANIDGGCEYSLNVTWYVT